MKVSCVPFFLALQLATASQPTAADVFQSAKRALQEAKSAAYVVTRDYTDSSGGKHKGHTSVLIANSPFGFRAEQHLDDGSSSTIAVSDGKTTLTTADGKQDRHDTFTPEGMSAMVVDSDAEFDVALTWHLLLDPEYLQKATDSGRTLYLWQSEMEGEPCHLIIYARDHWTDYIWVSTKTGYPRAIQRVNMIRGRALLSPRYEIGNIRLNPEFPTNAFRLQENPSATAPSANSSAVSTEAKEPLSTGSAPDVIAQSLPDLELRDLQYKPTPLSSLRGSPALITFWAPWCAPCMEELAALGKIQKSFPQLQIVAIAVQDRREKVLDFIRAHPQYKFLFFTDPDMERQTSPLASFFGISGIPVTVLTDAQGKIVDKWPGFEGEEDLRNRLTRLMQRYG